MYIYKYSLLAIPLRGLPLFVYAVCFAPVEAACLAPPAYGTYLALRKYAFTHHPSSPRRATTGEHTGQYNCL